jgi:nitroreductase
MFAPMQAPLPAADQMLSLLRYTVLAPSFRNSQPWRFAVGERAIRVYADTGDPRFAAAIPPRERDLSLGCAIENLAIAAEAFGLLEGVRLLPDPDEPRWVAEVRLAPDRNPPRPIVRALFDAIPERHTDTGSFLPSPVPHRVRELLRSAVVEREIGLVLVDAVEVRRALETVLANARSVDAILARLGPLLRPVSGPPNDGHPADLVVAAPLFGAIVAEHDDRLTWLRGGRAFERVWLTATAFGLHLHPLSELLLHDETVAAVLPWVRDGVPLVPFRLGYGRLERRRTHRRPLRDVIIPWPADDRSATNGASAAGAADEP